jgi:hypothetical protein
MSMIETGTCRRLCDLADALLERAPWEEMPETEIFTLQGEPDGPTYFVSVMGAAGEHQAVAFYPGRESFLKFCLAQRDDLHPRDALETMLVNAHWQVGFEPRAGLRPAEKAALRTAGRRYRGRWPVFRSHREARVPWPATEPEARMLLPLLSGAIEVLDRRAAGDEVTAPFTADEFFLLRADGSSGVCRVQDLPLARHRLQAMLDPGALDGLSRSKVKAELELALLLTPIAEVPPGEPPFFPYLLLLADAESGAVLGAELIPTGDGADAALVQLPQAVAALIRGAGSVPACIAVRHPVLRSALEASGRLLGFEVRPQPVLPLAEMALAALEGRVRG